MSFRTAKVRRPATETRRIMIEHGVAQLAREGIGLGLDHLTLDAACAATDVARSSSHSAWSRGDRSPQANYQRAVIEAWILRRDSRPQGDEIGRAVAQVVADSEGRPTISAVIGAAVRTAVEITASPLEPDPGSGYLSSDMAVKHALASQPPEARDPELMAIISDVEVEFRRKRVDETYRSLAAILGLRPRAEFGDDAFEWLAVSVASLVEGVVMRDELISGRDYVGGVVRQGDALREPATLLGVAVESLVLTFFEPDTPTN